MFFIASSIPSVPSLLNAGSDFLDFSPDDFHVCFWSHDSEGTLADILPAVKMNNTDFIFLIDHPHGNLDTLPGDYNGRFGIF